MKQDGQLNRAYQFTKLFSTALWYGFNRRLGGWIDHEEGILEQRVASLMCRKMLSDFGLSVTVEGAENLEKIDRRYAIISNHLSYLDWVIHLAAFPSPPAFIAKKEVTWYPVIGPYLQSRGVLIDRKAGFGARQAIAAAAKADQRWPILIFPEGTRSPDGELKEFKRGGMTVIAEANMPMVPVVILGSHEAFPKGKPTIRPNRRIKLIIGEPVEPGDFEDTKVLIQRMHDQMKQVYDSRRGEILDALPNGEGAAGVTVHEGSG